MASHPTELQGEDAELYDLCMNFGWQMFARMLEQKYRGRTGRQNLNCVRIWKEIVEHVVKGDAIDIANFCAFAWHQDGHVIGEGPDCPYQFMVKVRKAISEALLDEDEDED